MNRGPIIYPGEPLPAHIPGHWVRVGDGWVWQDDSWIAA